MATDTQEKPAVKRGPFSPADLDSHQADLERRRLEREKKRPTLRRCLDPVVAAQHEARKPLYDWEVTVNFDRQDEKSGRIKARTETVRVQAQTEAEAWARFCDSIQEYPGPKNCERTIKRLEKVN